jgi:hypothetical protein
MKYLLSFVISICLFSTTLKAQSFVAAYSASISPTKAHFGRNNLTIDDIKGSPYLDSEYKVGTILTTEDVLYKDVPLRYNCYGGVMEFKKDNTSYELKPEEKLKKVEFGGQVFVYKAYVSDKGGTDKTFFEVLTEGKASLCVRFSVNFYEAEALQGFADPKPARFDDISETYYVAVNNSPAKKFSNSKKLVEILGDKQKDIETFISKQKLSAKKAEDLKKIIAYYNTL